MKKIIFVTNYFGNGGAATVMKTIITYLQNDYNIEIVTFTDDDKKYDLPKTVKYTKLNDKMILTKTDKIKSVLKLRKIIKREKEAIVIAFEYFINLRTIIAMIGLKNRLIISERNDPSKVGNKHRHIRNLLYRFSDALICQTEDAKNYFPKYIRKKTTVILNPIKSGLPDSYKGEREKIIVNFCRLEKQKNIKMLINAYEAVSKKHPDYKLYIYGDGVEKSNILNYIEQKQMNNQIFLFPFDSNIHEKIKKYTMFVSSSDYEGLSNSMLEAMAIGLPTICTDCPCGGAKMVIKNGKNGLLTPVGNEKILSQKINELIENKELQEKISSNSVKIKEELSSENIIQQWLKVIE